MRFIVPSVLAAALSVSAHAADPVLRNWGHGASRGLDTTVTAQALMATDVDTVAASLVYTITTAPTKGTLRNNGVALAVAGTFTQADIDAGRVIYRHTAGTNDAFDQVSFSLTDGTVTQNHVLYIGVGPGAAATKPLRIQKIGQYSVPAGFNSNGGVAEIVAHDAGSKRLILVNGATGQADVLGFAFDQVAAPPLLGSLVPSSVVATATDITSVACHNGLVALAVSNTVRSSPGYVFFYRASDLSYVSHIDFSTALPQTGGVAGALPDMVTFTPDGSKVLLAIEGEPASDYSVDPLGGVVVVAVTAGVPATTASWIGFDDANTAAYKAAGVRINNDRASTAPAASAAKDLEPEYITVSPDGLTAYVSIQEANSLAVINLTTLSLTAVLPLGSKDHSRAGNELDASDEDTGVNTNSGGPVINITTQPIRGLYMPDGIASFSVGGKTYVVTANEGDGRDYTAVVDEPRLRSASLSPTWTTANPNGSFDSNLGRLRISAFDGLDDGGKIATPYTFGARSFTIRDTAGAVVWDSGAQMERFFATYLPTNFNANHTSNSLDGRSAAKGPEPEMVVTGVIDGRTYAFVGLERMGGFMTFDVTTPSAPTFVSYSTGRKFDQTPGNGTGGDLGPEGMLLIPAATSPTGRPLMVIGNEVSGTVGIHELLAGATNTDDTNRYVMPVASGVMVKPLITVGETPQASTYKMVGLADGLGAFDNGDGTFTLLMNHEIGSSGSPAVPLGAVRTHGSAGGFVSRWTISKTAGSAANNSYAVTAGQDLNTSATSVFLWPTTASTWGAGTTTVYARLCSADLAPTTAFYNAVSGKGTTARIFLNGEETGDEGRTFGHVATGADAGKSFELPHLGKASWENWVASPWAQDTTVAIGLDDTTPGQLYVYAGMKQSTGNDVEKAGLVGGTLYGVIANGMASEDRTNAVGGAKNVGVPFTLASLGNTAAKTGATIQTESVTAGVTQFLRPEDGAWDPSNPRDFYFVTTDRFDTSKNGGSTGTAQVGRSRLYRLRFTDLARPSAGGAITMLIDGTESINGAGIQMMDNICVDRFGRIIIQEDSGNQDWSSRTWMYEIGSGAITEIAKSDPARFGDRTGGVTIAPTAPFTRDDENSGVIDASDLLGAGWYLGVNQAHGAGAPFNTTELVEGGQLFAMYIPLANNTADSNRYVVPVAAGVVVKPLITVGETPAIGSSYQMVGLPDGLGAFDNGDGTFTVLMNHEIGNRFTAPFDLLGAVRTHGSAGGFVSRWVINKMPGSAPNSSYAMMSGADFNTSTTSVYLWPTTATTWSAGTTTAFLRPCSADLADASAFWNPATGMGTSARIFLNGEETGDEGRTFGHIATGADAGKSFELPHLGKASWENWIACPFSQDTTFAIGTDDTTPGQTYVYVGTKRNTGNDVEKAGLTGGNLYGVKVGTMAFEDRTAGVSSIKGADIPFTLASLGNVANRTGAQIQAASQAAGITEFLRPEDGAFDPSRPSDFYFVTTDRFDTSKNGGSTGTATVGRSRLFRLRFTDLANPAAGGMLTMLMDGTEPGVQMMDNICVDRFGRVIIQEDSGNQDWSSRIWMYEIASGKITEIAKSDPARFGDRTGGVTIAPTAPFTRDDENSGIIDASTILGDGWYLGVNQAHGAGAPYNTTTLIEGGQLFAMYIPTPALSGNTAPVAANDSLSAAVAGPRIVIDATFLAQNDSDADGDKFVVTGVGATTLAGSSVQFIDGRVIYTPSTTAAAGATDTFTYTVRDGVWVTPIFGNTATPLVAASGSLPPVGNTGLGSSITGVWGRPWDFLAMTDRGPNVTDLTGNKVFPAPAFAPRAVTLNVNPANGVVTTGAAVTFKTTAGANRNGIPNAGPTTSGFNPTGESAVSTTGAAIAADNNGVDPEGIVMLADGSYWQSDEYGPYLALYNNAGVLQRQMNPFINDSAGHKLPSVLQYRQANAGMESLCVTPSGWIVGLMQRPMSYTEAATTATFGTSATTSNTQATQYLRFVAYNPATGQVKQYAYIMGDPAATNNTSGTTRPSAMCALSDTEFLVLERDGNFPNAAGTSKKVWKVNIAGATDVQETANAAIGVGADYQFGRLLGTGSSIATYMTLEEASITSPALAISTLASLGVSVPTKSLAADLIVRAGASYDHDKVEGLIMIGGRWLVVANDDDFGVVDTAPASSSYVAKTIANSTAIVPSTGVTDYNQLMVVDLAKGSSATGTVTVTYAAAGTNTSPTLSGLSAKTISEDSSAMFDISVNDAETDPSTLAVTVTSSNLTLLPASGITIAMVSDNANGRSLTLKPAANATGTSTVTVSVSDGTNTTTGTLVLTVTAVNDAPVAHSGSITLSADEPTSFTTTATDAENEALTYSLVSGTSMGALSLNAATRTWTFHSADKNASGTTSFTWRATDASGAVSNIATQTITITAKGDSEDECGVGGIGAVLLGLLALIGLRRRRA